LPHVETDEEFQNREGMNLTVHLENTFALNQSNSHPAWFHQDPQQLHHHIE
jgi:hypothetical protein